MNYEALLAHEDFVRDLARRLIRDEHGREYGEASPIR